MYRPPILGFDEWRTNPLAHVQWKDGTPVTTLGLLGDMSVETLARRKAEQVRKQELRQQTNIVLLEDWRKRTKGYGVSIT